MHKELDWQWSFTCRTKKFSGKLFLLAW